MDAYLFFREIDEGGLAILNELVEAGTLRFAMPCLGDNAALAAAEGGDLGEIQDVVARVRGAGLSPGTTHLATGPVIPIPPLPAPLRLAKRAIVALCSVKVAPGSVEAFVEQVESDERLGAIVPVLGGRTQYLIEVAADSVDDVYAAQEGLRAIEGVRVSTSVGTFDNSRGAVAAAD